MGLYRPTDGLVRLDGFELDQLPPTIIRRNIGCVPQDVTLFFGSVRDNIMLGNRAQLNDPPILVMDEPTSNMDNQSEMHVKQELARLGPETTLILITHKTSMLDVASRVIVVEQGKIVADAPKEVVLQQLKEGKVRVQETANG